MAKRGGRDRSDRGSDSDSSSLTGVQFKRQEPLSRDEEAELGGKKNAAKLAAQETLAGSPWIAQRFLDIFVGIFESNKAAEKKYRFDNVVDIAANKNSAAKVEARKKVSGARQPLADLIAENKAAITKILDANQCSITSQRDGSEHYEVLKSYQGKLSKMIIELDIKLEFTIRLNDKLRLFALETELLRARVEASGRKSNDCSQAIEGIHQELFKLKRVPNEQQIVLRTPEELNALTERLKELRENRAPSEEQAASTSKLGRVIFLEQQLASKLKKLRELPEQKSQYDDNEQYERQEQRLKAELEELKEAARNLNKKPVTRDEKLAMEQALRRRILELGEMPKEALERVDKTNQQLVSFNKSRDEFVGKNFPLVNWFITKKSPFAGFATGPKGHENMSEMFAAGLVGLNRAAEKFDSSRGIKFGTYATGWIRQALMKWKESREDGPANMQQEIARLIQSDGRLQHKLGRDCTTEERVLEYLESRSPRVDFSKMDPSDLKKQLNNTERLIALLDALKAPKVSVSQQGRGDRSSGSYNDLLDPSNSVTYCDDSDGNKAILSGLLSNLNDRQRRILELRYGLSGEKPQTLQEVGEVFSVSKERIRQIEKDALRKIGELVNQHGAGPNPNPDQTPDVS
ncbi:MAG: sigma-70 family RNA polymerase sigma factor [Pseudomonadota bacterium]